MNIYTNMRILRIEENQDSIHQDNMAVVFTYTKGEPEDVIKAMTSKKEAHRLYQEGGIYNISIGKVDEAIEIPRKDFDLQAEMTIWKQEFSHSNRNDTGITTMREDSEIYYSPNSFVNLVFPDVETALSLNPKRRYRVTFEDIGDVIKERE